MVAPLNSSSSASPDRVQSNQREIKSPKGLFGTQTGVLSQTLQQQLEAADYSTPLSRSSARGPTIKIVLDSTATEWTIHEQVAIEASKFIRACLTNQCTEKSTGRITIRDWAEEDSMETLINEIYHPGLIHKDYAVRKIYYDRNQPSHEGLVKLEKRLLETYALADLFIMPHLKFSIMKNFIIHTPVALETVMHGFRVVPYDSAIYNFLMDVLFTKWKSQSATDEVRAAVTTLSRENADFSDSFINKTMNGAANCGPKHFSSYTFKDGGSLPPPGWEKTFYSEVLQLPTLFGSMAFK